MPRIEGKIALVTGGARGIGEAIIRLFHQEGAKVVITDINNQEGQKLAKELGENAVYFHLDVSQESEWQKVMDETQKKFGQLDILVNNAGIMGYEGGMGPQDPENTSLESWHKVHAVNLDGTFLGCKYAIKAMKDHGGTIVNMSSRSGLVGVPSAAAYASSKAAIRNHTKSVALYCAQKNYNIRCNSVHPAAIITPMWDPMLGTHREETMKKLSHQTPMQRFGTPEEVAYAVLFLASNESSYMTGSELTLDGGILAGSAASPEQD